jgi:hypothetical protein
MEVVLGLGSLRWSDAVPVFALTAISQSPQVLVVR